MITIIDFLPFIWYTIGYINGTLPLKGFPRLLPGKSFPGKKPRKHLNKEIKVSKTAQSKMLGLIFFGL
jgi:hypothetical protein